ncbi:MAG: PSD1 and planctomycete cytochrome C domain-containing protein, partial [Candidatus Hydrogenedentes bacterium]|nr:PSD1 and planctomycete cytochrome C domain-containing protein [Candidatus Hydrogenedentota bacterium]
MPETIGFNRHVRPILSDKCYACHGPDAKTRKADLRLDLPPSESQQEDSTPTIVPGDPDGSELVRRILTTDADDQMPPSDVEKQLTLRQKAILRAWVAQGGVYEPHWAYVPPIRAGMPAAEADPSHPIDTFIARRLGEEGFTPQPEADKRTLIRRLYWDLLGLPPTPNAVDAYLNDNDPSAYDRLVDSLLASPHYGERMTMDWLDLVRYADSNGYHSDEFRSISAYRDYVLGAFNSNMPFDRFTREQLAGDLLPEPTRGQLVASGYNRLNQITAEGGAQAKEYIAKYAADRVRTTGTVWLGTTMGCAECHDHKFDPISTRDFYSFGAFFADIEEKGVYSSGSAWAPFMYLPTPEEEAKEQDLTAAIQALETTLSTTTPDLDSARVAWESVVKAQRDAVESPWHVATPSQTKTQGETVLDALEDGRLLARGKAKAKDVYTLHVPTGDGAIRALMLETFNHPELDGVSRGGGNFVMTQFRVAYRAPGADASAPVALVSAVADYAQTDFPASNTLNDDKNRGWAVDGHLKKEDHAIIFRFQEPLQTAAGGQLEVSLHFESAHSKHQIDCFRLKYTDDETAAATTWAVLPEAIRATLMLEEEGRSDEQRTALANYFIETTPRLQPERDMLAARRDELKALKGAMATTLITKALPEPRIMRVLPRGNWQDESGVEVLPDTPEALPALGVAGRRANRLDLANWLVREDNPLTARVTMNR